MNNDSYPRVDDRMSPTSRRITILVDVKKSWENRRTGKNAHIKSALSTVSNIEKSDAATLLCVPAHGKHKIYVEHVDQPTACQ